MPCPYQRECPCHNSCHRSCDYESSFNPVTFLIAVTIVAVLVNAAISRQPEQLPPSRSAVYHQNAS
jgi:hypothetical protein